MRLQAGEDRQAQFLLPHISREEDGKISKELCVSAGAMANALGCIV